MRGEASSAYKELLLAGTMNDDRDWRELFFLTLIGLDSPLDAAASVLEERNASEDETARARILLKRSGFRRETPRFAPEGKPVAVPKDVAKKAVAIAAAKGSAFVLTPDALYTYPESGAPPSFFTVTGGRELLVNGRGEPLILTANSLVSPSASIPLPLGITNASSFAQAPDGCFYILDSAGKVFLLDSSGKVREERQILIKKPSRIRTDSLYRVFLLSGGESDISVYGAAFAPLFVMSPEALGVPSGKILDFAVDFAGNPLMLERGRKELLFFNYSKNFLGRSLERTFEADLFSWDGGGSLLVLDRKSCHLIRVSL